MIRVKSLVVSVLSLFLVVIMASLTEADGVKEETILSVMNSGGVGNGPTQQTVFNYQSPIKSPM